jgi:polysaccharide export outer membrane protein
MKNLYLLLSIVILSLNSCVPQKDLTYLQNNSQAQLDSTGFYKQFRQDYIIQNNDVLNLNFKSFDEKSTQIFSSNIAVNGGNQVNDGTIYLNGNSVDNYGFIDLPVLGKVKVAGLKLSEAKSAIEKRLYEYFKQDAVYLKLQLAGIRFSVVGEVKRPGKYVIYQNEANIFEAISMAGDISMVGKRKEIQLIRQTPNGVKIYELDLTDDSVLNSPYYFLHPYDIINVKPMKIKSWGIGENGFQTIVSITSLISTTILLIITIRNPQ